MEQEAAVCNGEEWRPVVGYEYAYEVSDNGRVRRILDVRGSRAGRVLKSHASKNGYLYIGLINQNTGVRDVKTVHGIVAEAFHGRRPAKHFVNHIDGNRSNPAAENLEYVTPNQNQAHAARLGNSHYKLTPEIVREIRARHGQLQSTRLTAKEFGINKSYCAAVVSKKYWPDV